MSMTTTTNENFDRTVSGLKDSVAGATAGIEQAQASMRDGMQKAMKSAEEMIAFTQGNFEAMTKASQIFATGMQDLSHSFAATARASMDETVNTFKAIASVKSVKEAVDLQRKLLRSAMETAVSHAGQVTDTSLKLSEQAFAPIGARLALATEKFGHIG